MKHKEDKPDFYYTVSESCRTELKIKGSSFIASIVHVDSKENAMLQLDLIASEFHDATHNCFAYRIGCDGLEFRSSDDGEPSGTAGKPILFALTKSGLSDSLIVVTRYFGGTKLGVGGLARAYSDAAFQVINIVHKKQVFKSKSIKVLCTYEDISHIKKLIDQYAVSFKEYYADAAEFIVEITVSKISEFENAVTSATKGRAGTLHNFE